MRGHNSKSNGSEGLTQGLRRVMFSSVLVKKPTVTLVLFFGWLVGFFKIPFELTNLQF